MFTSKGGSCQLGKKIKKEWSVVLAMTIVAPNAEVAAAMAVEASTVARGGIFAAISVLLVASSTQVEKYQNCMC